MSNERDGARSAHAVLEILNGGFTGMVYELSAAETLLGRSPTSDVTLLDEGISREHAIVCFDPETGRYTIEDLQSTNGTEVNGKRVRSAVLGDADEIKIGNTRLRFVRDGVPGAAV